MSQRRVNKKPPRLLKSTRKTTPCCRAIWLWEQFGGMRLFSVVNGRKKYRAKCETCGISYELDGGIG
jgi:hypothetical protein